jgi:hypothetical protein
LSEQLYALPFPVRKLNVKKENGGQMAVNYSEHPISR